MKGQNILIVEDEEICAAIIAHNLESEGYCITIAKDADQAWEMLWNASESYQLILLDRMLPNQDGLAFLKKLKATPEFHQLPVILETAMINEESIREGMEAGAYYYLTKPLQINLLKAIVSVAIAESNEYQRLQLAARQDQECLYLHLQQAVINYRTLDDAKHLARALAQTCPDPGRVIIGLQELLINAVEHGNLGITYKEKTQLMLSGGWLDEVNRRLSLPENYRLKIKVCFERNAEKITFIIQDQGKGFDWAQYLEFAPERAFDPHGRGIAMARMMSFDSMIYHGIGNIVEVSILLPPGAEINPE